MNHGLSCRGARDKLAKVDDQMSGCLQHTGWSLTCIAQSWQNKHAW